ncbi:Ail/Lom family outer membrane beta-barrel protein [Erwinia tasmaniensis]|uniref:Ail/Lom family outer membrane beta-barrel protein n=1 Tax=Erwinia tasmaniensis TaxID=338565 RepID=UPI003A4DAAD5
MKKLYTSLFVLAALSGAAPTHAEQHTLSLGYAQSKVQDFKNIRGVNAKYRYEYDSALGIISSFTYMNGKEDYHFSNAFNTVSRSADLKYYSLAVGPAYRFNQYISLYGLLGVNYNKSHIEKMWQNSSLRYQETSGNNKASFMYGLGIQINPLDSLAIDIGYEGSNLDDAGNHLSINGFNIGLGYRF